MSLIIADGIARRKNSHFGRIFNYDQLFALDLKNDLNHQYNSLRFAPNSRLANYFNLSCKFLKKMMQISKLLKGVIVPDLEFMNLMSISEHRSVFHASNFFKLRNDQIMTFSSKYFYTIHS